VQQLYCPTCGQRVINYGDVIAPDNLTAREAEIFFLIARAGVYGISTDELVVRLQDFDVKYPYRTVWVHIYRLRRKCRANGIILMLECRYGRYRLYTERGNVVSEVSCGSLPTSPLSSESSNDRHATITGTDKGSVSD
jgi:hypothetical protein